MQLSLPWRYGQAKPWGSLPRINWSHPLTVGLLSYCYDVGVPLDLVSGKQGQIISGTNHLTRGVKPIGGGLVYPGVKGASDAFVMPINPLMTSFAQALPYSMVMGYFGRSTNSGSTWVETCGTSFAQGVRFGEFIANEWQVNVSGGVSITGGGGSFVDNIYNTLHFSVVSATTWNVYLNGTLNRSSTTETSALTVTASNQQVMINNDTFLNSLGSAGGVINGMMPYVAFWNRPLTAPEARLLHDDPYCFLIFPEDEMFATLVGVTTTATTFFQGSEPDFLWQKWTAQPYGPMTGVSSR